MLVKDIKLGQVVYLNSGGPPMTVQAIDRDSAEKYTKINVLWFSPDAMIHSYNFPPNVLTDAGPEFKLRLV